MNESQGEVLRLERSPFPELQLNFKKRDLSVRGGRHLREPGPHCKLTWLCERPPPRGSEAGGSINRLRSWLVIVLKSKSD